MPSLQIETMKMLDNAFRHANPPIEAMECPKWLEKLTREQIENDEFPRKDVLDGSFYYPACGEDGGVILFLGRFCHSFIYVDYLADKDKVRTDMKKQFKDGGYDLVGMRELTTKDLSPIGVPTTKACAGINRTEYTKFSKSDTSEPLFVLWAIYERHTELTLEYGPQRFSLVYIGGEGVASYAALYNGNGLYPRWIAMIQCDGFACNWTEFKNPFKPLHELVIENQAGQPQFIVEGAGGADPISPWPEYGPDRLTAIHSYYGNKHNHCGTVNIFNCNNEI